MSVNHHYNPYIYKIINSYVQLHNWNGMKMYLSGLSHSQFRTACNILSEEILLSLDGPGFWTCFYEIVPNNTKAFLHTFLKSAVKLYNKNKLQLHDDHFIQFALWIVAGQRQIDQTKTLHVLLPLVHTVEEVNFLLSSFQIESVYDRINYLIQTKTPPCYYVLFQCFKNIDHQVDLLTQYGNLLIAKNDDKSYNLVAMMKNYFDLPLIKGNFSLKLNTYELSCLDKSFDEFILILNRV